MKEEYLKEGLKIIKELNALAFQAYIVGGAVRDFIMHNDFVDIDIASSARPQDLAMIYPQVNLEYQDLGFVTLKREGMIFEISTFKKEIYDVPRKPSKIYYSTNLLDDVMRRDFTINALALTDNMQVIDLVGGQKDIRNKLIRIIGNPKKRFEEDPLRILRAYELIARFNFHLSISTAYGITKCNKMLKSISHYQISKAITKIFDSLYGKKAIKVMIENKTNRYLEDYADGLYVIAKHYKKLSKEEKLALCYAYKNHIPENTCLDKNTLFKVTRLLKCIDATKGYNKDDGINPRLLVEYGLEDTLSAVKINHLIRKRYPNLSVKVKHAYQHLPIKSFSELKIKGTDIIDLNNGYKGSYVSEILKELTDEVIIGMIRNDRKELIDRASEILKDMKPNDNYDNKKHHNQSDAIDYQQIKDCFDIELKEKVEQTLNVLLSGEESEEEITRIREDIKKKVKENLIMKNSEYQKLQERGMI